ncbi:oxytocin-neurophysin 1 [Chanos chanos]|uniref:Oxytocin-neurophysin 1 n=1 Tax=Chanos chanos TaxID=29144 RepID=A0A6J2UYV7_CHACN|nr:isotocin-neurophysin IT 1-like [Chanos chanos]
MSGAPVSAFCLLCLLWIGSACYISNCPIGGKRAALDFPARKCMACGPADRGRCFGPSICCGEGIGCLVGSPDTVRCLEEDYLPSPCEAGGRLCGSGEGHCAAQGICCDSEGCSMDQSCLDDEGESNLSQLESGRDHLMNLLHLARHTYPLRLHQ